MSPVMKAFWRSRGSYVSISLCVLYFSVLNSDNNTVLGQSTSSSCASYDYIFTVGSAENPFGSCSGNGFCNNSKCICDKGWTGLSDFVNTEGLDCQIYDPAVRGLWAFDILLASIVLVKSASRVKARWENFLAGRRMARERGRHYTILENKPLIASIFYWFVLFPCLILFAIVRITKSDERVGVTFGVTFFFLMCKFGFYMAGFYFYTSLFEAVLKGAIIRQSGLRTDSLIKANYMFAALGAVISISAGILPFISLGLNDFKSSQAIWVSYLIFLFLSLVWYTAQGVYIRLKVKEVFGLSYKLSKNQTLKEIQNKLEDMQKALIIQASVQMIFFLCFFMVPFLWNKHDYFLPMSWITYVVLGKKLAFTVVDAKGSSELSKSTKMVGPNLVNRNDTEDLMTDLRSSKDLVDSI